jgi:hypothetical protein
VPGVCARLGVRQPLAEDESEGKTLMRTPETPTELMQRPAQDAIAEKQAAIKADIESAIYARRHAERAGEGFDIAAWSWIDDDTLPPNPDEAAEVLAMRRCLRETAEAIHEAEQAHALKKARVAAPQTVDVLLRTWPDDTRPEEIVADLREEGVTDTRVLCWVLILQARFSAATISHVLEIGMPKGSVLRAALAAHLDTNPDLKAKLSPLQIRCAYGGRGSGAHLRKRTLAKQVEEAEA